MYKNDTYTLEEKTLKPFVYRSDLIGLCLENSFPEGAKSLIENSYFNPSKNFDVDLATVVSFKNLELIELILNNKNSNPTRRNNYLICSAYKDNLNDIVDLFFDNQKVRDSLMKDNLDLYINLNRKYVSDKLSNF